MWHPYRNAVSLSREQPATAKKGNDTFGEGNTPSPGCNVWIAPVPAFTRPAACSGPRSRVQEFATVPAPEPGTTADGLWEGLRIHYGPVVLIVRSWQILLPASCGPYAIVALTGL
jgi:hypothetical protein